MSEQEELYRKRDEMRGEMYADIKHMVKWTETHDQKDDERFEKIDKKLAIVDKLIYGGVGVIVFVEFVMKLTK